MSTGSKVVTLRSRLAAPDRVPAAGDLARRVPRSAAWLLTGMAAAAIVVAVGILGGAGELRGDPAGLLDPGLLVRVGLPVARTLQDLAASLTIGLLVLAVWAVAPESGSSDDRLTGSRAAMVRVASVSVGAWLLSATAVLVFTVADVAGLRLDAPTFSATVLGFVTQVELGRALWVSLLLVVAVAVLTVLSARVTCAAWAAGVALVALLPLALTGHASGSGDHQNSASSLALHLVTVTLWVGGLTALLLTARRLGAQLPAVVRRYSTLAGWCFALVALSGVVNAALRLGSLSKLTTLYGVLALAKVAALGLLGLAGWRHRRAILPRLEQSRGRRAFLRLAGVELLVMGATMGLAVALSRSAAPTAAHPPAHTPAELLGYVPPPLTPASYLTEFYPDLLWLLAALAALAWYLRAVVRLRRQGQAWPLARTLAWLAGCLALTAATSGGVAVYARTSFSAHMVQHLSLMLAVPLLLVLGAPLTLALRTLPSRPDGSVGLRETLVMVLHSRPLAVLRDPVAAAGLLAGGFIAFYYVTGAFQLALFTHTGHVLMTVYFLAAGCLFVWVLLGADQDRARSAYPLQIRLLTLTLTSILLAIFGLTLQRSTTVLAARWWGALGQEDVGALLQDQRLGGQLVWVTGIVLLVVAGAAFTRHGLRQTRGGGSLGSAGAQPASAESVEKAPALAGGGTSRP
ncbi:MAG: cytochrome c oxidase assembly protein [Friedmanniella sp.]